MQTIINPIISPITPIMPIYAYNITGSTFSIALIVLSALAVIGMSVLIGWVLSKVMASKGMVSKPIFNLIASGAIGLCLFLRFGISVELIQGLFLFFVLLYASMSDLTTHMVDDFVWITVFALALAINSTTISLSALTINSFGSGVAPLKSVSCLAPFFSALKISALLINHPLNFFDICV